MFNRLSNFKSHFISEIRNLVELYYVFCQQPDTSVYITNLLYKNQYFCNNIENVSNPGHS